MITTAILHKIMGYYSNNSENYKITRYYNNNSETI